MMKRFVSFALALALLCLCLPVFAETADAVTVTDMTGRELTLSAPAARIVVLDPADQEILYAIGAGDQVVGRGDYCNYPEAVQAVPSVASFYETNLEQIIALEPDVVVMTTMAQTEEQVNALTEAGITVVSTNVQALDSVYEDIALLGTVSGHEEEAAQLTASMQEALTVQDEDTGLSVYVEVSYWEGTIYSMGSGEFLDDLIDLAGMTNAFADTEGWPTLSAEQVIERNPDIIIDISGYNSAEAISAREGWGDIAAVKNGRIYCVDADVFSRQGPRLAEAMATLRQIASEAK